MKYPIGTLVRFINDGSASGRTGVRGQLALIEKPHNSQDAVYVRLLVLKDSQRNEIVGIWENRIEKV